MHRQVPAAEVAHTLTTHGHPDATTRPTWQPGHRATQASPRTVRLWHDGPNEQQHLDQYTATLRTTGHTVTAEQPAGKRPRLRITQQTKEQP